ncbi:AAA family ATPase [Vibrio splendidus]|uniref:AAA family ATPase n=1 Tax=Vibrio splendidus TaxID=29497 RepID=UPI0006CA4D40|nr:AAA family ATPase [Vibrio splendidus]KPM01485.1 chromosome segregation protein SMC [Vibrio splendidus]
MLTRIKVSTFKSLVDFELKLGKFNCIIGLNGSGKSTVLQMISYVSSLFKGDIQRWLDSRGWENKDVVSHFFPTRKTLEVALDYSFDGKNYRWVGTYHLEKGVCTKELLVELEDTSENRLLYRVSNGIYSSPAHRVELNFKYSGSVLATLNDDFLPHEAIRIRDYIAQIESHDLLSPKVMRSGQYSRQGRLGSSGEFLIHHIHSLDDAEKTVLTVKLAEYFKQVVKLDTKPLTDGTIELSLTERFYNDDGTHRDIITNAKHINDGMLRLLNILANQRTEEIRFQLFDEIENGVNPEVTEHLMDSFVNSPQQTLVTTHSPMALNYLEESVAVDSVILIYKPKNGMTKAKHLFEIPSAKAKLAELAPGEVMVDLYLERVTEEAAEIVISESQS